MDDYKKIIREEIAPLVQNGDLALFLGAGASIGTPTINGMTVPSTGDLISRICAQAGYSAEEVAGTDLPTSFGVGQDEIDNFDNFITSNFVVSRVHDWQLNIFRNWWRAIFTTNIDSIPEHCIKVNAGKADFPDYKIYNYLDREPVQSIPTAPPVVYLHGMANRPANGFVFDNVSYADNSIKQSDWLGKAALHISHGNCLFVGSRFKESDIEASIRMREIWETGTTERNVNWIVLDSFTPLEKKYYEKRGIKPIQMLAKDFFEYLFSLVSSLSQRKFIKRKAPHLIDNQDSSSAAWFIDNVFSVKKELDHAALKKGPLTLFYSGAIPDWFYISKKVPAAFKVLKKIETEILEFEASSEKALLIPIVGPLGSGKTTMAMSALAKIAETKNNIFIYSGFDGINIEALWAVLKDMKGLVVIYVDAASTYFYAINEIFVKVLSSNVSCQLCFVVEERGIHYDRNKRHFHQIPHSVIKKINIGSIDVEDALVLFDKTTSLGLNFPKLAGFDRVKAANKIVDFDNGYNGDLLATLYDLSTEGSYRDRLVEEYTEIPDGIAKEIFQTLSIVTASRISIPINYLAEIHKVSIDGIVKIFGEDLNGKIIYGGVSMAASARHHSIAEFHVKNSIEKSELKQRIISLMKCLSTKFTTSDIKKHPISYRIYSKVMSYHYLTETLFGHRSLYFHISDIYSACQEFFSADGVFWLQYGRFLERSGDVPSALHCFRKGLGLYDSFQIRHALGHLLLKKFRTSSVPSDDDFDEGIALLMREIAERGQTDSYPHTTLGNELLKLCEVDRRAAECRAILKDILNRGINYHREDVYFMEIFNRYIKLFKDVSLG